VPVQHHIAYIVGDVNGDRIRLGVVLIVGIVGVEGLVIGFDFTDDMLTVVSGDAEFELIHKLKNIILFHCKLFGFVIQYRHYGEGVRVVANYILVYDLLSKEHDYGTFLEAVKVFKNERITEHTWLIQTPKEASYVRDQLMAFMDEGDRIFVGELSGSFAWANPITPSKLLQSKLKS
jgi:hypothetical protein